MRNTRRSETVIIITAEVYIYFLVVGGGECGKASDSPAPKQTLLGCPPGLGLDAAVPSVCGSSVFSAACALSGHGWLCQVSEG